MNSCEGDPHNTTLLIKKKQAKKGYKTNWKGIRGRERERGGEEKEKEEENQLSRV
jgi:hypothetical protein